MKKETCFLGEGYPISSSAMFLKVVSEGDIFIRRPWSFFHDRFVTAWSPSHGLLGHWWTEYTTRIDQWQREKVNVFGEDSGLEKMSKESTKDVVIRTQCDGLQLLIAWLCLTCLFSFFPFWLAYTCHSLLSIPMLSVFLCKNGKSWWKKQSIMRVFKIYSINIFLHPSINLM